MMKKIVLLLLAVAGLNGIMNAQNEHTEKSYADMDVDRFAILLANDEVQLVDVRTPEEYEDGHIDKAVNIDFFNPEFVDLALKSLDKTKPVAVYCRSGKRSAKAATLLAEKGYSVTNLSGGFQAWQKVR